MASNIQQTLYDLFAGIATGPSTDLSGILSAVLGSSGTATGTASGNGSKGSSVLESVASTVLKSGLGMMPLLNGILHLFGGSDPPAPPPLVKYGMPPRLDILTGTGADSITEMDADQFGIPRPYERTTADSGAAPSVPAASTSMAAPQITVNVQAMDARSFLDRSTDIAAAVREAMLHMNSINDVINEL
jgi:hypothetical protein